MSNRSNRSADYPIHPMFLERWSPRAFAAVPITESELMAILEAARWAPSSFNAQPWRFVYARRDTATWPGFVDLLTPRNQEWARHASALVFLVSKATMRPIGADIDQPSATHALDAGAASGYMALQAHLSGWHVHGMAGFDRDRAQGVLNVPRDHQVLAVYAFGRIGDPASLPEALRAREQPSSRAPLATFTFAGRFPD
jgi:nitroreductase